MSAKIYEKRPEWLGEDYDKLDLPSGTKWYTSVHQQGALATLKRADEQGKMTWLHLLTEAYWAVSCSTEDDELKKALQKVSAIVSAWEGKI